MKANAFSFLVGLIFGIGLIISGMANPAKVVGFLDLAGSWDPSLALVMAGAIGVSFFAFRSGSQRQKSILGLPIQIPTRKDIDGRLVTGAVMFGAGWGIAGFCPGPALVAVGAANSDAMIFVAAMLAGMLIFEKFGKSMA